VMRFHVCGNRAAMPRTNWKQPCVCRYRDNRSNGRQNRTRDQIKWDGGPAWNEVEWETQWIKGRGQAREANRHDRSNQTTTINLRPMTINSKGSTVVHKNWPMHKICPPPLTDYVTIHQISRSCPLKSQYIYIHLFCSVVCQKETISIST
jgi:hypothetical protein